MRRSLGLMTISDTSSASAMMATVQAEVWMRPCASVAGTRCTRCAPDSNEPAVGAVAVDARDHFLSPSSDGLSDISSTRQPRCSA